MTLRLSTCFLLFILFFSGTTGKKIFAYRILQDGNEVLIKKNAVVLAKRPFAIEFTFDNPAGIFVNASFKEIYFKAEKCNKPLAKIPGFKGNNIAEGDFNTAKSITVNDNAPNYWFYEDARSNRFDAVNTDNGMITCERRSEEFHLSENSQVMKAEHADKNLYLVFLFLQRGKSDEADKELQRDFLRISWK